MYLTALTLKDFAGLADVSIEGFERGLNVVVGDNEAGKSTLLMGLRAAFFQKHRATGEAARQLAPYGRQVRPEVEVDFETGGTAYRLRKGFLQRPEARLTFAGGDVSGDAVEEHLARLLGFAHPGAGRAKLDEHQGAFGLLWVEQGRSDQHALDLGVGKDAVTASLEGEIGQILGGERGRALLVAAKAAEERFFTATGRASAQSPLKKAEEALTALRGELVDRQAVHADYEEKIERLRRRRETLLSYMRDDAVGVAERAVEAAEERARQVSGFAREHGEAEREIGHAVARRDAAVETLRVRERLEAETIAAEAARDAGAAMLVDLGAAHAEARDEAVLLETARDAARHADLAAERREEAMSARAERERLKADIARLDARITEAKAIEARIAELAGASALSGSKASLDHKALKALDAAEQARREAEILLGQSAPTLAFAPLDGRSVRDETGRPIDLAAPLKVLGRMVVDLEGFGRLTIEPGGNASDLKRGLAAATATFDTLKARHGVASLDAAREAVRLAEEQAGEVALSKKQLAAILPEGLGAAESALAQNRMRLARLEAEMRAGLPDALPSEPVDAQTARQARKTARETLASAETALDCARSALSTFAARLARAEAEHEHGAGLASRLRGRLAEAAAARAKGALVEDVAAAEVERAAKAAILSIRRRDLDAADPSTVALTLQAKRRAVEEIRRTVAGLKDEAAALEGELRAQGLSSLGEDIERLREEIAVLDRRAQRLALEASATRLLAKTLQEAQRAAREHWLGPIKAQVTPYLRLIHPESEVAFDDETLAITGLHRRGVEEDFRRLSAGAREQVAVVTRLALASVLKRGGHPALVILDDALVNTDERRLERMHLVLQRAAEAMQIIVLTCRERDFRGLGGRMFRL